MKPVASDRGTGRAPSGSASIGVTCPHASGIGAAAQPKQSTGVDASCNNMERAVCAAGPDAILPAPEVARWTIDSVGRLMRARGAAAGCD